MKRLIALAVTSTLLLPGTAAAAKPSPFKLVKTTGLRGDDTLTSVVAPSRKSAFAFGFRKLKQRTEPLVYRWNGKKWKRAGLPEGVTGTFGEAEAASASDVWATLPGRNGASDPDVPDPCEPARQAAPGTFGTSKVLHWDGKRWKVAASFKDAFVHELAVAGPKDVWAYGQDKAGPAAFHFDGSAWKRHDFGIGIGSASHSGKDIWAMAYTAKETYVARFDGTTWTRSKPPQFRDTPPQTKDTVGYASQLLGVDAVGRDDVWATAMVTKGTQCGEQDHDSPIVRWDGKAWQRVKISRLMKAFLIESFVPDGRGGVYAKGWGSDSRDEWDIERGVFHLEKNGTWKRWILPSGADAVAAIPGTRSFWTVGAKETRTGDEGAIWLKQ